MMDVSYFPLLDITEQETRFVIKLDAPGLSLDHLKIHLEKNGFWIIGERSSEQTKEMFGRTLLSERPYGEFKRYIKLGPDFDPGSVLVSQQRGVIRIEYKKC